jgi:hypothetical protein
MSDQKLNQEAKQWRLATMGKLKAQWDKYGIIHRPESRSVVAALDLLKSTTTSKYGVLSSIRFKFPRHMVFVHKGVGRGHPISNPRRAKPWFNEILDKEIEGLADIVAENTADKIVSDSFERLRIR